ncbi:unnamed protein product [marine sediment metagenome]|uniref:Uncharacterized protein n=1 Tax=marine sediment metagenome TaxID=412755 RepID=X1FWR4_9ZZZZ
MAGNRELEDFLMRHERLQSVIDSTAFKGRCSTLDELKEQVGAGPEEMKLQYTLFEVDNYVAHPLEGVSCSRDAIRIISERLETALK